MYKSKASAERAYSGYLASKRTETSLGSVVAAKRKHKKDLERVAKD
jgi:hypothetical protein